jgi:DNA-binding transcriptional LysR family regulator
MNNAAEFRHFRYLLAVAEHRGFRAAAQYLHTSQPALSKQAKEFQEAFQIELFQKTKSGGIRLTPTGAAFIPIARDLLEARDDAITALISIHRKEAVILRLGCTSIVDGEVCQLACKLHKGLAANCAIRPSVGETKQLLEDLAADEIDAALVTLPVFDDRFRVEIIKRDRLVVCLPGDHPLASKPTLLPKDLEGNLTIFRHPSHHPAAHARLVELLAEVGLALNALSHASHPLETQTLVKGGYGFALIREGSALEPGLTTRPILGVDWTVDTVLLFKKQTRLKTLPILARSLRRAYASSIELGVFKKPSAPAKRNEPPSQMSLLS